MCVRYSVVSSSVTPWTVALAYQAPLSMEFSRQEYRSGEPFLSPGDLSSLGIKLRSPPLQIDSLPSEPLEMYRWLLILESVGGGKKLGGKEEVELSLKVVF